MINEDIFPHLGQMATHIHIRFLPAKDPSFLPGILFSSTQAGLPEFVRYHLLNPKLIGHNTDVFENAAKKYNVNLSFRDNGYYLSADYNDDRRVSRAEAKNQQVAKNRPC